MSKHTPAPSWRVHAPWHTSADSVITADIYDAHDLVVAEDLDADDAAYIVTACNAFPALVEALQAFVAAYDAQAWPIENDIGLFERARAALAQAGVSE